MRLKKIISLALAIAAATWLLLPTPLRDAVLQAQANVKNYFAACQGAACDNIFEVGGSVDVASGGEIDFESGSSFKLAGTAVTATAAELNALAGTGLSATELGLLDTATVGSITNSKAVTRTAAGLIPLDSGTLAALGTIQGDAAAIVTDVVVVTASDGTKGVVLPAGATGLSVRVINSVATAGNTLKVYPASGGTINALAGDAAFVLGPGKVGLFTATSATQWYVADIASVTAITSALNGAVANSVGGVAASYKIARSEMALDGSNPTTVASGLTTIIACTVTLKGTAAPGVGTSILTGNISTTNFDVYAWKVTTSTDNTLIASTGTESFYMVCVGT